MRKRIIIFGIIILIVVVSVLMLNYNEGDRVIYIDEKSNQVVNTNALTMMYETEAGSGEYQVSNDTNWPQEGYSFNEKLSRCENGGELSWNDETKRVIMKANTSDKCYIYFDKVLTLAEYITTQVYTGTDGDNGLYYHDGSGSYINADQEAGDNSYRYAGANPNNYVCFGSDEEVCPDDSLYRIIGLFTDAGAYQAKLIKNSSYGNYNWSDSVPSLNATYYANFTVNWQNKIVSKNWTNSVWDYINESSTPKDFFEVETETGFSLYDTKIGLMYVSDYGYAASPDRWISYLNYCNGDSCKNSNWMYMGDIEWTIIKSGYNENIAFNISYNGSVDSNDDGYITNTYAVRPTFYLESSVALSGGTGTASDPYRVQM